MKKVSSTFSPLICIDRKASRPLHRQVYDAFRNAIISRNLRAGQRIPSSRSLASELRISRIPVLNAYAQLSAEGYIESRVGSGAFISSSLADLPPVPVEENFPSYPVQRTPRPVANHSSTLPRYERPAYTKGFGAFRLGSPAIDAFPLQAWSKLAARYWRNLDLRALRYGGPMGLRSLREAIATYLRAARSVHCEWRQIMIVSGSQQALNISTRVLLEAGSPVWVEEPGYWLTRSVLTAAGCRLVPVPVDEDGMNVAAGIKRCRKARAAYVTPSHQFPLGALLSASRRLQLLEWAQGSGSWIVEDDYDSEYRYDSKPIASLQGLDPFSRVIHIGTFSKVLFPSLRLGYIVIPPDLVDHFIATRHIMDHSPPHLSQAMLSDFINEGHFARHIRRMRLVYGERQEVLMNSIHAELGSVLEITGAGAGLHLTVTLPKGYGDRAISELAARQRLWLWPLSKSYVGTDSRQGFILGFGGVRKSEIADSVRRLHSVINDQRTP